MLTLQSFKDGRTIYAWDLRTSQCGDVLHLEKSGSLRLNIQTSTALTENYAVILLGITSGLIEIFGNRTVKTSFLM